jgi:hypothetical protein
MDETTDSELMAIINKYSIHKVNTSYQAYGCKDAGKGHYPGYGDL